MLLVFSFKCYLCDFYEIRIYTWMEQSKWK